MNSTELTLPANVDRQTVGYVVNSSFSEDNLATLVAIQKEIALPLNDAIWIVPPSALHITLLDLLTPGTSYHEDKDTLYDKHGPTYISALDKILASQAPISVTFDTIEVHPAAIIIKGHDDGSYDKIRNQFLSIVDLDPITKKPPTIIHSTIAKFQKPIALDRVRSVLADKSIRVVNEVKNFRVVREHQIYMRNYQLIKNYRLNKM